MEPTNLWARVIQFLKESLTHKFKYFFPGCIMGLFGAKSIFFARIPVEVITLGAFFLKFAGTVIMAVGSGFGTAFGAKLVERKKKK